MADETLNITVEDATALGTELTQAFNPRRARPGARLPRARRRLAA